MNYSFPTILSYIGRIGLFFITLLAVGTATNAAGVEPPTKPIYLYDGNRIQIGVPQVPTEKGTKHRSFGNLNFQYKQIIEQHQVTQTVTLMPSGVYKGNAVLEIPLILPNGYSIQWGKENTVATNRMGNIYDPSKRSVGLIYIEPIQNVVQGKVTTTLTKGSWKITASPTDLNKPVELKIHLQATNYSTYYQETKWIQRGAMESLSIVYKKSAISNSRGIDQIIVTDMWDKLVDKHQKDLKWGNEKGLKNQFSCHFYFATEKKEWNIEPIRKSDDYWTTIMKSCNP